MDGRVLAINYIVERTLERVAGRVEKKIMETEIEENKNSYLLQSLIRELNFDNAYGYLSLETPEKEKEVQYTGDSLSSRASTNEYAETR